MIKIKTDEIFIVYMAFMHICMAPAELWKLRQKRKDNHAVMFDNVMLQVFKPFLHFMGVFFLKWWFSVKLNVICFKWTGHSSASDTKSSFRQSLISYKTLCVPVFFPFESCNYTQSFQQFPNKINVFLLCPPLYIVYTRSVLHVLDLLCPTCPG